MESKFGWKMRYKQVENKQMWIKNREYKLVDEVKRMIIRSLLKKLQNQ